MNSDLLINGRGKAVNEYLTKKFTLWKGWTFSKGTRDSKVAQYYVVAADANKQEIRSLYATIYRTPWPQTLVEAQTTKMNAKAGTRKIARQDAVEMMEDRKSDLQDVLYKLNQWDQEGKAQEGPAFFELLKSTVEAVLPGALNRTEYITEHEIRRTAELTHSSSLSNSSLNAQFDFLAGMKGKASIAFEFDRTYLQGISKLESELKAGGWGNGSVKASLTKAGVQANAAVALACGMNFEVTADSTWTIGPLGAKLEGNGTFFAGASANASASLNISATTLAASVAAGAFAGIQASATGKCSMLYEGEELCSASGTANVSIGAGATFNAGISASLFGPTSITLASNLALGLGTGASTETSVNFTLMALAASAQFQRVVNLRTISQGWSMDLQTQEHKNRHYLRKSITRVQAAIDEQEDKIASVNKVPEERQSLLMAADD
ncbi:hypothetical protein [Granulicella arctica]|uniref:hypothetical protein n=1 Tax=Granulicella arctica TaxID=940613 RepID=UPI0021E011B4|nr:hypothetical protein [Granulicella arctica]